MGTNAEDAFEEAIRGERGGDLNPYGRAGKPTEEINRNEMTVDLDQAATLPISPRVRDYSRESKQGTSVGYCLRRLERQAPELRERVRQGELTPNAAMVNAGLRPRVPTVPAESAVSTRLRCTIG